MLKYIMRDKQLQRIPVIMMSLHDEVSIVVKCLKFGAADYLLGLAEKNILNFDFDLVASEHSDPNTNSTTLLSDDTDDKSWKCVNREMCPSTMQQEEAGYKSNSSTDAAPIETAVVVPFEHQSDAPGTDDQRTGEISPFPKKSELKKGESSAFFTYVKSSFPTSNGQTPTSIHGCAPQQWGIEEKTKMDGHEHIDTNIQVTGDVEKQGISTLQELQNGGILSGVVNHVMMPSTQIYYESMQHLHNHANSSMVPQYNHMPQYPYMHGMPSYPFYPIGMCVQPPGQMQTAHPWHSFGSSSSAEIKASKDDLRETALMKFRQKRKERCFDKKIRYVNWKQLAERRPRLRGQFVRKVNGVNVVLNGQPASADNDDVEEEEEDEEKQIEFLDSSHEDDL